MFSIVIYSFRLPHGVLIKADTVMAFESGVEKVKIITNIRLDIPI